MKATKTLLPALLVLACCAVFSPAAANAQASTPLEEQTFDYTPPDDEQTPQLAQPIVRATYEDADIVNDPVYGTYALSRHRWKNWIMRALYLVLINIALIAIILSLSKTEEYNIIISYILSGASLSLSFWVFLCAVLLFRLKSYSWTYIFLASAATSAVGYLVVMKIKKCDVSLTELKESFKQLRSVSREDHRLASVDGSPGDWPDQDFTR